MQPISSMWRSLFFLPVSFSLQKNIYFCFMDYDKTFDCVDRSKLWQILKEIEIPDHLAWLLRNLYARHEATVRTRRGTMDWFKIWKICQQWPQDWKRSVFIPISKKNNAKECSNYHITVLISYVSKVMFKSFKVGFSGA